MPFPPPPNGATDWSKLSTVVSDQVAGHVESRYDGKTGVWSEPVFVQDPYLRIHGLSPALNYGQQIYEGLKAYRDPKGSISIFRPDSHAKRMASSAAFVSIPDIPESHFLHCVHLAVSKNAEWVPPHKSGALYIRPLAFGAGGHLSLTPPSEYVLAVYVQPFATYMGTNAVDALILEEFDRAAPMGVGSGKVGGNYAPVIRWSDKARAEGFGLTLHLDSKTRSEIEEFSAAGFLALKYPKEEVESERAITVVIPDSLNVIKSITSESCIKVAQSLGWNVEIRRVPYSELSTFQEVVAVGSAVSVLPIRSITCRSTGDKFTYDTGTHSPKLAAILTDIQQGTVDDTFGWLQEVKEMKDANGL